MRARSDRIRCLPTLKLLAVLALLAQCAVRPAPALSQSSQVEHDLTVVVLADTDVPRVAMSYSRMIEHERLLEGITMMMSSVGGEASEVRIEDAPLAPGDPRPATGAEFAAPGLIAWDSGMLPVGPIIRSLPDWQHMRLVFLVGEESLFHGPGNAMVDGYTVHLIGDMQAYEYDVESNTGIVTPREPPTTAGAGLALIIPAVLIGVPTGFVLGWVFSDPRLRDGRRR